MNKKQQGFSIMAAVFILGILALSMSYILSMAALARYSNNLALQGVRAYYAARTGIEVATFQALNGGTCSAFTTLPTMTGTLAPFLVTTICSSTTFIQSGVTYTNYLIKSYGNRAGILSNSGLPDYVVRQVNTVITTAPPSS